MKKIAALLFVCSVAALTATAQKSLNHKYVFPEWEEHPVIHDLPPAYAHESALILDHTVSLDYRYEGKSTNVYYTLHRLVKVMDYRGIEMFNKVSIPVGYHTRIPLIKARTILMSGKVIDIPKDMIKVTKNEFGQYEVVFAMEGLEKNAEVELLLKEIRPYSAFGSENFQYPIPVVNTHFEINYPRDIVFEEKGFNGFPDAKDMFVGNRRHISITVANIPALREEPNSFYDVYRQRAEYRVHKFINENRIDTARILTWDHYSRSIFDDYYRITQKERAAVNKYLITLGARPTNSDEDNVRLIEDGIKKNIVLYGDVEGENTEVLDSIIANKAASPAGYIKLMAACFTQAEVKHELGMAFNRKEHRFNTNFENWHNMDNYLFYFPHLNKFLSPLSAYTRYPIVPEEVIGLQAVFCTIPPKRDVTGPIAEIRKVIPIGASASRDDIAAHVSFTDNMDADVDISYSFSGYAASDLRKAFLLEPKVKEKEIINSVVSIAEKQSDIKKYTVTNAAVNSTYTNAPLEITAKVNTAALTEKAGPKYLFKLGALMGPHANLYYEKKRVMPVDLDYPVSMIRKFTINIPKGYRVKNLEAIKKDAEYVNRQLQPVISFHSSYVLKTDRKNGDKLIVNVIEYYPRIHFENTEYEKFRNVVNTAADFNKVVLLLERTGGARSNAIAKAGKGKKVQHQM